MTFSSLHSTGRDGILLNISVPLLSNSSIKWRQKVPVGVRFNPSDEALLGTFLAEKVRHHTDNSLLPLLGEVAVYECTEPSDLRRLTYDFGDGKMYFFTRISPKGSKGKRFKRTIQCDKNQGKGGNICWKKSGVPCKVNSKNGELIGTKTSLIFCKEDEEYGKQGWQMKEYMLEKKLYEELGGKLSEPILVLCVVYLNKEHEQNPNPSSGKRPCPVDHEFNSSPNSKEPRGANLPDVQIPNQVPDYNFTGFFSTLDSDESWLLDDEQTVMHHHQPPLLLENEIDNFLSDPTHNFDSMFLDESGATNPNAHIPNQSYFPENGENDALVDLKHRASVTSYPGECLALTDQQNFMDHQPAQHLSNNKIRTDFPGPIDNLRCRILDKSQSSALDESFTSLSHTTTAGAGQLVRGDCAGIEIYIPWSSVG